ncbi:hypothetical protein ACQEVF_22225 [Nonomuraea polychroma]|uniref:hypothetical protein n=1 Tax=Nonomuraea polychroma TaxID=46176 RepID=UPI003D8F3D5B
MATRQTTASAITADELRQMYGQTWEIRTDLANGVAAWRKTNVTSAQYDAGLLNVFCAGSLDELAQKIAGQVEREQELGGLGNVR